MLTKNHIATSFMLITTLFATATQANSILTGATVQLDRIQHYQVFRDSMYQGDVVNQHSYSFVESDPIVEVPRFDEYLGWTVDFVSDPGATDLDILNGSQSILLNGNALFINWKDCCYTGNGITTDANYFGRGQAAQFVMIFEGYEFTFTPPDTSQSYQFTNVINHSSWLPDNRILVTGNKISLDLKDGVHYGSSYGALELTFDVSVAAVPIPATFWLMSSTLAGIGLLGLGSRRFRL